MRTTVKTFILLAAALLPLAFAPSVSSASGASRIVVCLDPGHGGSDSGAVGNGLLEKDLNLDIALKARPLIEAAGFTVLMTRQSDVYVSLEERCRIANEARATIFVSIHNNAFTSTSEGTETFCYYDSIEGRRLASSIHREVVSRIDRVDRGVKEAGFYVLNNTDMPAALLEGAFITNVGDAECLADPKFRRKIAEGVAAGTVGYLADPGRFDEYILIMNPDEAKSAEVSVEFMTGDGREDGDNLLVPPGARVTVYVDEQFRNADVSARVISGNGVGVVAERAVYFDFERGRGGHCAAGVVAPAQTWHLAEGSTSWGLSTFVLVQNPGEEENFVVMEFMRSDGVHKRFKYWLAPRSRFTLDVSNVPGFEEADFSVRVDSEKPVVVERAMYFTDFRGLAGGHCSAGVTEPQRQWYLAEGYTGKGFDSFILIENPNDLPAAVQMQYMLPGGGNVAGACEVAPRSRYSIHLNEVEGLAETDVSARIDSTLPLVVERSMYFDYNGVREGSNSTAVHGPSRSWYLAEGYTGGGFDTYVLLQNPNETETGVILEFMMPKGRRVKKGVTLAARSRRTFKLNDIPGLENTEVSTFVSSQAPVVAERSVYFRSGSRAGGHNAMGVTAPAVEWYFAEGCTR